MPTQTDLAQSRRESAELIGLDAERLSPADTLRCDMISSLRLVIDHEQATVLDGNSADLARLNIAVTSLIGLLPGKELPEPASSGPDPREIMWQTYLTMRRRGGISEHGTLVDGLRAEVAALRAEIAQLKGQPAALGSAAMGKIPHRMGKIPQPMTAIVDPTEVVPPCEIADRDPGMRPGPDDPKPPTVIEGTADAVDLRAGYNDTPEPWRRFSHLYE